jgi:hypothetical protein
MASNFKPRQYYCAQAVTAACKKGFTSRAGWIRHKNAVHAGLQKPRARPRQHPYHSPRKQSENVDLEEDQESADSSDVDITVESNMMDALPVGVYYVTHPVLDGKFHPFVVSKILVIRQLFIYNNRYSLQCPWSGLATWYPA